jgi:hypothetical protein
MDDNPHPVDSSGIELADVDIMEGLFDRLDAIAAVETLAQRLSAHNNKEKNE